MDTVRADSMGLCGYGRDITPQLDRLAKLSVTVDRAVE
jgi:glucan phosphoethanolaminetransferase (alkaline phosphatase superfamily)